MAGNVVEYKQASIADFGYIFDFFNVSDTQQIKEKIDIVDFITEYVQLRPAGVNHKGLCPFHHEKSPSFMASRERQSWHCFGCGKGGDIFSFIQEIEGMDFVEALKYLAGRAGVTLSTSRASEVQTSQKNRMKEINSVAAGFFHNFLLRLPVSKPALEYLANRGLKDETIEEWQIGFVSDQWDLLTGYLLKKGFAIDDLVASGLTIKKERAEPSRLNSVSGLYDRFRGRIMFPIWDIHDAVVGFTGRVLVETEHSGGKYVNTPQTVLYDKSKVVFGLNKAKKEIKSQDLIVMVEGQMDVIACHQAGMKNVVATSGTALTDEQVRILKRYSANLSIAFDADSAGQAAADRGIDIAREQGMAVKVIKIPDGGGKDPDECLKKNPEIWTRAVADAEQIMRFYFDSALKDKNMSNPQEGQAAVNLALNKIIKIPYAVEREFWLKELSGIIGVEMSVLRENMKELRQNEKKPLDRKKVVNAEIGKARIDPEEAGLLSLVESLLALVIKMPTILSENRLNSLRNNAGIHRFILSTPGFGALYEQILKVYTANNGLSLDSLREQYANDRPENLIDILLMKGELDFFEISGSDAEKEFRNILIRIDDRIIKKRRNELQREIEAAARTGDKKKESELLQEFSEL